VYYTTGRFVTGRACCGLDVFGYGGWVGREEVLCEIRWNALKKVRVLRDAGESIILFFIIIIIISIIFFLCTVTPNQFHFRVCNAQEVIDQSENSAKPKTVMCG